MLRDFPRTVFERHELHDRHLPGVQKLLYREYYDIIELVTLIIKRDQRGLGIGSEALWEVKKHSKRIYLHAVADRGREEDLCRFYERNGFQLVPDTNEFPTYLWIPDGSEKTHSYKFPKPQAVYCDLGSWDHFDRRSERRR